MEPLIIESTLKTPEIMFNSQTGIFEIKGMSCAEYALDFYKPVYNWIEKYVENPLPKTTINIQFKYFNTSSAKCILQLFEKLVKVETSGASLEVNWFYSKNDEQMLADGENYSEIIGIAFNLQELAK